MIQWKLDCRSSKQKRKRQPCLYSFHLSQILYLVFSWLIFWISKNGNRKPFNSLKKSGRAWRNIGTSRIYISSQPYNKHCSIIFFCFTTTLLGIEDCDWFILPLCFRLRQCSLHWMVSDGVISGIGILLPTPTIALRFWLRLRLRLRR